jgi:hypothetical protein
MSIFDSLLVCREGKMVEKHCFLEPSRFSTTSEVSAVLKRSQASVVPAS